MTRYTMTLASPGTREHEGLGGFFDEVYVKDNKEQRVLAKFYGPESWGQARKLTEKLEFEHSVELYREQVIDQLARDLSRNRRAYKAPLRQYCMYSVIMVELPNGQLIKERRKNV